MNSCTDQTKTKRKRLPEWIRRPMNTDIDFADVHSLMRNHGLHTVCEEAKCPNRHECWNKGTATVMILGDYCTRSCAFCAIKAGKPEGLDTDEPRRVAEACGRMKVKHLVITSVARDDLADGGASIFAETITRVRAASPGCTVEVLTPDFEANPDSMRIVLEAAPEVFNHNLETVRRLQPVIRPQATYGRSLRTLQIASEWRPQLEVKSGIMLGLGESDEEVEEALVDLYKAGCTILTLGQYLQPAKEYATVERYVTPEAFDTFAHLAKKIGFAAVASSPFVRSSYRSEELYKEALAHRSAKT